MKMSNMKKLLLLALLPAFVTISAYANEVKISVTAPIDASDHASLQRGAKIFVNNCLNCHSANYMRYNRLKDIGLTEKQIKDNLLFAGEDRKSTRLNSSHPSISRMPSSA